MANVMTAKDAVSGSLAECFVTVNDDGDMPEKFSGLDGMQ